MYDFVHLHVHSDYSLLDGAASIDSLVHKAKAFGMKHLAITDHGNMFGALKFYKKCLEQEIHPIIGSEFYMAPTSRHEKKGSEQGNKYYHLLLLATSEQGYRNLMKLSSLSYTEGFYYKPRIDEELLIQYGKDLIGLSACLGGEIPSLLLEGKLAEAEARARRLRDILGDNNFYLELQDHGIPEQKKANALLVALSKRTGIPLVATNDIHYLEPEDAVAQDILLCISTNKKRSEISRMRFESNQFYMKSPEEMAALFPDYPEALLNTVRIAERCDTKIPLPGPLLPDFTLPEPFTEEAAYIRHLTYQGLAQRYGTVTPAIKERADYELNIIIKMGFVGYFLIVADFITWAKDHGIPVGPGRGSGAGSIVAYAMKITDIDPLKYNLLFERFLNPERVSMPDFDVDFCFERRGEVIDYVTQKYGRNRVGQIITFGTLKAKAVIKDVARALDIPLAEANMIAKLIPEDPKMTLKKAFEAEPRLVKLAEDPRYQELFTIARKLENKNRHSSLHAAGIVIGKTELTDYVPLYRDAKTGTVATQFTMDQIEECGLVKMDFLGLKTLTLIKNTEDLIHRRGGEYAHFSIEHISEEDEATFALLGEGKSASVFQFESQGMQNILKQAKPNKIEDLIALNALYRPGPMAYIPQFIDSKWGRQPIVYPDPCLEPILKETYGVIVYQEQVMQVAQTIAGYSLGQADLLRRAMGKKKPEVMVKEKSRFIEGAVKRGFKQEEADRIFEILIPFAGYGFNKSHAAAYSVLAYRTAYLKANFPAEFMAANLTNEISNPDKLKEYIDEARKMGLTIEPPDINRSGKYFTVVDGVIVYGLLGIKGLGDAAADEILKHREQGPYQDFMDFLDRVDLRTVTKKTIELLIKTGAFDSLGRSRPVLLANLDRAVEYAQNKKEDKKFGQSSLFEETGEKEYPDFEFDDAPDWDVKEQLKVEMELIGFYFSGHPMDPYRQVWERSVTLDLSHPEQSTPGKEYIILGMLKGLRPFQTKNGKWMGFGTLADYRGEIDLTFFPEIWERLRDHLTVEDIVALQGKVDTKRERPSFLVEHMLDIHNLVERSYREVHIRLRRQALRAENQLYPLRDELFGLSGNCTLYIHVPLTEGEAVIKAASQISLSADPAVLEHLHHFEAVSEVWRE
ncbi:MAG: DNA polymerase III subunit alpha [Treponemataceae bacterium]|nr:DNA polymerase III subunit alpha [Treponemataceae bacterium]